MGSEKSMKQKQTTTMIVLLAIAMMIVPVGAVVLEGDINGDGWVGLPDLSVLGTHWGEHVWK